MPTDITYIGQRRCKLHTSHAAPAFLLIQPTARHEEKNEGIWRENGDHRSRQQTRIRHDGFRMPGVGTRPYALARRGCGEGRRGGTARPRHPALRRKRTAALDEGALRSAAVHHRRLFAWRTLRAVGGKGRRSSSALWLPLRRRCG